jgi:FkbM family methyltransferase
VGSTVRKTWFKLRLLVLEALLRPTRPWNMVRLGSYYGGWWVPEGSPSDGCAVCVGAGLDVSFDLEMQRLGYEVHTVDPTPAAVEFVSTRAPSLGLVPVGLWDQDGHLTFRQDGTFAESWFPAETPTGVPSAHTQTFEVVTVRTLLDRIGRDDVAVLKIDIEGAEHRVIRSLLADGIRPRTLCVEFDDPGLVPVLRTSRLLRRSGYALYQIENYNFTFVLASVTLDESSPDQVARKEIQARARGAAA